MYKIERITTDARQKQTLVLPDGTQIVISIYFVPMQFGWFITAISYGPSNFVLNGLRITNSYDMLYQWRNKIPFGLACFSKSNREPTQAEDFSSGASELFVITAAEVEEYRELLSG